MKDETELFRQLGFHKQEAVKYLQDQGFAEGKDYSVNYIALQGSQNYGIAHENSDVDSRLMINPSKHSLLMKYNFTHDFKMENGEICVIRSTMDALEPLFKGNVNGLEVLYTKYFIPYDNVWPFIRGKREIIESTFRDNMVKASFGMMKQKKASLLKSTGGCQAEFFEKHGYNGKDYIHINRLFDIIKRISRNQEFETAINWGCLEFVQKVRNGDYDISSVVIHTDALIKNVETSVDKFLDKFDITSETQMVVKTCIREEVATMLSKNG